MSDEPEFGGVYFANVNPGAISTRTHTSLQNLRIYDTDCGANSFRGELFQESGANISKGRNDLVRNFLTQPDGDWLLFFDSDMVFPPNTHLRLQAAAYAAGCQIIGGLVVMTGELGPIPTLYQYDRVDGSDATTRVQFDHPTDTLLEVAATGCAMLMIHRDVLVEMRDRATADREWLNANRDVLDEAARRDLLKSPAEKYAWFGEQVRNKRLVLPDGSLLSEEFVGENWISEDIEFCLRARMGGHRIFVDCTFEIGHVKAGRVWTASDIRKGIGRPPARVVAVIPSKTVEFVEALVPQIADQCDEIIVCDNGFDRPPVADVTVYDCRGQGIHEMWNTGIEHVQQHTLAARTHVAFLNDDLNVAPDALTLMSKALTDDRELVAVSANYDGRDGPPTIDVTDICAGRYDGTGGLAGFAFMLRGEWLTSGYRFPTEMMWWFGDNDLMLAIAANSTAESPKRAAIVTAARVEHLDGGSKTGGDWSEFQDQIAKDREAFERRWSERPTPTPHPFPHLVIDGVWDADLLRRVADEFPDPSDERWVRRDDPHEQKLGGREDMWGPATRELFDAIAASAPMLGDVFGIPDLEMETVGGGFHLIEPGGVLDMHTDFTRSPTSDRYRRLNLMIYLNEGWDDAGGHLRIGADVDVAPEFNRTVIFATSDRSWHGHPEPAQRARKSVAAYFFSPEEPDGFVEQSTVWADDTTDLGGNPYGSIRPVEGGSLEAGKAYHDIPGVPGPVYRSGSAERVAHFAPWLGDIANMYGVDIGCSVGGVTTALSDLGADMVGCDHDEAAIATAKRLGRGDFFLADLTDPTTWDAIELAGYDFAVWLSQWMWLAKQTSHDEACARLDQLSRSVPVLVFETAQGPGDGMAGSDLVVGAEGVRQLLREHTAYRTVADIGPTPGQNWEGGRSVFICHNDPVTATGTVQPGHGAAAGDVEAGVYGDLGFDPYPGTLNLRRKKITRIFGEDVDPFVIPMETTWGLPERTVTYAGIERRLWRCDFGWVMTHDSDPDVIELISMERLRDSYDDGDQVTVELV